MFNLNDLFNSLSVIADKIDPEDKKKITNSVLDIAGSYIFNPKPVENKDSLSCEGLEKKALYSNKAELEITKTEETGFFSTFPNIIPSIETIKKLTNEFFDSKEIPPSEFLKEKVYENLKEFLIEKFSIIEDYLPQDAMISITEEVIKRVSPIEANIKESITRKSVVIDEKALNDYLQNNFKDNKEVNNIKLTILGQNIFEIEAEIEKLKVKSQLKQKILLTDFKINKEEGYAKMKVLGDINLQSERWVDKIVLSLIKFIFKAIFKEKFMSYLEENQVKVDEKTLTVDLKNGALKKYYESPLSSVLDENISFVGSDYLIQGVSYITGTKTVMDIMEVKGVTSEIRKLIVDVAFKVPK